MDNKERNANQTQSETSSGNQVGDENISEQKMKISVVIPLLNEEESLVELAGKLKENLTTTVGQFWEVIFVDDGSNDNSYQIITNLNKNDNRFKAIRFRRNYGKSAALSVGFERAQGEVIMTMDADLQDDPAEIPNLFAKINEGYDLVSGWKKKRYDPISKTLPSKLFNKVTSIASGVRLHDFNCGLKAYKKDCAKSLHIYGEMHRFLPSLAHQDGFKVTEIVVKHQARKHGHSKFGSARFLNGFFDLITVVFVTRFFKKPLHLFGVLGFLSGFVGFAIDGYLLIQWMLGNTYLSNRPLAIFGLVLIVVGIQFISMGLIGEMIVKNSPMTNVYSIKETL